MATRFGLDGQEALPQDNFKFSSLFHLHCVCIPTIRTPSIARSQHHSTTSILLLIPQRILTKSCFLSPSYRTSFRRVTIPGIVRMGHTHGTTRTSHTYSRHECDQTHHHSNLQPLQPTPPYPNPNTPLSLPASHSLSRNSLRSSSHTTPMLRFDVWNRGERQRCSYLKERGPPSFNCAVPLPFPPPRSRTPLLGPSLTISFEREMITVLLLPKLNGSRREGLE